MEPQTILANKSIYYGYNPVLVSALELGFLVSPDSQHKD